MTSTQEYTLAWNHHESNISSGFKSLLKDQFLSDVTIAIDGHYLHAHRVVLAICSPYFRNLFEQCPSQHPIVIIPEVSFDTFNRLMEFMYLGEVKVAQNDFANLLQVAEKLKIKGLTKSELSDSPEKKKSVQPMRRKSTSESKPARPKSPKNCFWNIGFTIKQEKHVKYNGLTKEEQVLATNSEQDLRPRATGKKTRAAIELEESMGGKKSKMGNQVETKHSQTLPNLWKEPVDVEYKVVPQYHDSDTEDADIDIRPHLSTNTEEAPVASTDEPSSSLPPNASSDCSAMRNLQAVVQSGGIPRLFINGFAFRRRSFYKSRNRKNSHSVQWVCENINRTNCPAHCLSVNGNIKIWPKTHNHPPEDEPANEGDTVLISEAIPQFLCDASTKTTL